jgi:hypothetical protein
MLTYWTFIIACVLAGLMTPALYSIASQLKRIATALEKRTKRQ